LRRASENVCSQGGERSVVGAQQKVAATVGSAVQPAESQEAWIALNMRGGA